MTEYWSIFSQYFNPFGIIWGGIKVGVLGFIVALIILFILKRFVLIKRRYKILKYCAYSYYFLVPIICLCFGFIYGATTTSRDQIIDKLPRYQILINGLVKQTFNFNIEIAPSADKNLDDTLDDIVTNMQVKLTKKLKLANDNPNKLQKFLVIVLESPVGMNYIKSSLKEKISSASKLDRKLVDQVFEVKMSKLFTGETIVDFFSFYIKQMVNGFLMPIKVIWGLLLLLPLIEIILASYYHKRTQLFVAKNSVEIS